MTVKFFDKFVAPHVVTRSAILPGCAYRDDEGFTYLAVETPGDPPEVMLVELPSEKLGSYSVFPVEDIMPANGRTLVEVDMIITVTRKD